jgi:hypothetical protein
MSFSAYLVRISALQAVVAADPQRISGAAPVQFWSHRSSQLMDGRLELGMKLRESLTPWLLFTTCCWV